MTEFPDHPITAGAATPSIPDPPSPVAAMGAAVDVPAPEPAADLAAEVGSDPVVVPKPARGAPKWETDTRERVKTAIRRYTKPLNDLLSRDANEGDTRLFITDFLCDALGYDKYEDLTTEYRVKGEYADYGVRIDKQLIAFIEVKRIAQKLSPTHLRQVQAYAVNEGVEWVMLTNGHVWQVWHLTGGLPIIMDKALEVDLLSEESPAVKAGAMFYLTREAMKRHMMDELWKAQAATSPKSVAGVVLSDRVVEEIRKELKRRTGHTADASRIVEVLTRDVLRTDLTQ